MIAQTDMTTLVDVQPAVPIVLWTLAALGLVLCLTGRKLARPLFALIWMLLGAAIAFALPKGTADTTMTLVWVIAGGVIGAVLGYLLFSIWMGLGFALVLGLAIPIAGLAMHGQLPTLEPVEGESLMIDLEREPATDNNDPNAEGDTGELPIDMEEVIESLRELIASQEESIGQWWSSLGTGGQYTVTFCAGAGALMGLFIGLIGPRFAASVIAALIGSTLLLSALQQLNLPHLDPRLPASPKAALATIGLITAAGVVLQWTVFRRKADK